MFKIVNNIISLTRGDTANFTVRIKDADGNDYDYSDDLVLFTIKPNVYTKEFVCQKVVHYGEDVVIEHDDTASIPYGTYYYDVQISNAGVVATVIVPTPIRIMKEVTFNATVI